jgi:hypothetical protein
VRWAIHDLASDDFEASDRAYHTLFASDAFDWPRPERRAAVAALARFRANRAWEPDAVDAAAEALARIARSDVEAALAARDEPALAPLAYHALVLAGSGAAATAVTCEATLDATGAVPEGEPLSVDRPERATVNFEWGTQDWALGGTTSWSVALDRDGTLVTRRDAPAALADLGAIGLEGLTAAVLGASGERLRRSSASPERRARLPAVAGHTYLLVGPRGDSHPTAFRVLALEEGPRARIRWRLLD